MIFVGGSNRMLPIPNDILIPFDAIMAKKAISTALRTDYRKWLMYYLDFRVKYPPPDSRSEQVRLFIEKLRSKNQSQKQLVFWLSVNWTFSRFEINYLERRKVHAKKASQLHTRGEGCYPQASPGRAGSGLRPMRSVPSAADGFLSLATAVL